MPPQVAYWQALGPKIVPANEAAMREQPLTAPRRSAVASGRPAARCEHNDRA
jgi:hypothetical protein